MGIFDRLKGKAPEGKTGRTPAQPMPAPVQATIVDPIPAPASGDLDLAVALQLELPKREALPPQNSAEVDRILPMVMDHFKENRPEPASFPSLATRVIDMVEQPDVDLTEVARLIERDPAISASVLRVANSALYRRDNEVETVRAAITQLGLFQVSNLAVGVACKSLFDADARVEYEMFEMFWSRLSHHAMTAAFSASWYSMNRKMGRFDHAFMGGMFHDIGKTIAMRSITALVIEQKIKRPTDPMIDELLERAHVAVGVEMHNTWSLPKFLVAMCESHHDRVLGPEKENIELHILRVVSGFNMIRVDPQYFFRVHNEVVQSASTLGLKAAELGELYQRIDDFAEKVSSLYGIPDHSRKKRPE